MGEKARSAGPRNRGESRMKFDDSQLSFIDTDHYPYFCLANAGSGKTTSLLGKAQKLALAPDRKGNILILCFNRGIQDELQEKIRRQGLATLGVEARTLHSLGHLFVAKALHTEKLSCIPTSRNGHLYYGWIRREDRQKYGSYPGLLNKVLDHVGGQSVNGSMDADLNSQVNMLGIKVLTDECPQHTVFDFEPRLSKHFGALSALIARVLQKVKRTDPDYAASFAEGIAERYIESIDQRRKPVDFWKFFTKLFFRGNFVPFIHAAVTEFVFKEDLYGRFADDNLDTAHRAVPLFYLYCREEDSPSTYAEYSATLDRRVAAIAVSDLIMQVTQWKELDFDTMLSLGAYSLLKLKGGGYHAILVDEAQDLNLLYWYLTYEAFPKYLIHDKEKRVYFVGDTQQAINRWNYACPERFVALANSHARGQLIYTYRCPQAIVDKAQTIKDAALGTRVDLPEDKFISAAPPEHQPGEYSLIETIDATKIDEFLRDRGYRYDDIVILGRTNNDLLPWQLWVLLKQVPCEELLVNKLELTTEKTKSLLALVALADPKYQAPACAEKALVAFKGEEMARAFLDHIHAMDDEKQDETIMKFFTSLHMKDEEDLSDEELQEIIVGKGAVTLLRKWYALDEFSLRTDFEALMARKEFAINHQPNGISLSTIHRYKGKEKNVVLIQSNSWSNICRNADDVQAIEEERCLAYTALTRACRATHIIKGNVHPLL